MCEGNSKKQQSIPALKWQATSFDPHSWRTALDVQNAAFVGVDVEPDSLQGVGQVPEFGLQLRRTHGKLTAVCRLRTAESGVAKARLANSGTSDPSAAGGPDKLHVVPHYVGQWE